MAKRTVKTTAADPDDVLRRCARIVLARIGAGEYDVKLASHLAWLQQMDARTQNERAKASERERKRLGAMDRADVVAWLAQLPETDLADTIDEVKRRRRPRNVLG